MSRKATTLASKLVTQATCRFSTARSSLRLRPCVSHAVQAPCSRLLRQPFSTSSLRYAGIMPETDSPSRQPAAGRRPNYGVVELSDGQYHGLADHYLEAILAKFEQLQDAREDIDIEFSAGVMTITVTNKGTYVINKQPPNKQIWLSSPVSGPKRYDWCVVGEGQGEKEDTGSGNWIYTRDGVSLGELIMEELGVAIDTPVDS